MIRRSFDKVLTVIIRVYALAALASLGLAIVGVSGLFGLEPDPFASIFAMLFAMPWFFLVDTAYSDNSELWAFALLAAGMVVNFGILLALRHWVRRDNGVL